MRVNVFGWTFGIDPSNAAAVRWTQVFVAGFGSMVLFRSSLFVVRVGSSDIAVGPGGFLQIFLETADRAVDRGRARPRANAAATIMAGVSFSRAAEPLPAYCFALLQNVAAEEQKQFGMQVLGLQAAVSPDRAKSQLLGLALMNVVGESVLREAVRALGDDIR